MTRASGISTRQRHAFDRDASVTTSCKEVGKVSEMGLVLGILRVTEIYVRDLSLLRILGFFEVVVDLTQIQRESHRKRKQYTKHRQRMMSKRVLDASDSAFSTYLVSVGCCLHFMQNRKTSIVKRLVFDSETHQQNFFLPMNVFSNCSILSTVPATELSSYLITLLMSYCIGVRKRA